MMLTLKQADFPGQKYSGLRLLGRQINHKGWEFYLHNAGIFLCYAVIVALLLVIPAARSRAAWIAGAAGCMYVLWNHPGIAINRTKAISMFKRMSFNLRLTILASILILLISSATLLYLMKQGSASGRVLMWQVTWELVKQKPFGGHGSGSFNALYMPAQAKWFESGKGNDKQVVVAGSPQAPFNEPLGLLLEKGLIGILIAAGILFLIFDPGSVRPTRAGPVKNLHSQNIPISTSVALKGTLLSILQNTLGDSHKALGNYLAAETAYLKSSQMIPYLLFPRYLLAKLYYESGQHGKAIQVAEELINSPVKVESSVVNEIRTEMESLLLHMQSTTKTGQD